MGAYRPRHTAVGAYRPRHTAVGAYRPRQRQHEQPSTLLLERVISGAAPSLIEPAARRPAAHSPMFGPPAMVQCFQPNLESYPCHRAAVDHRRATDGLAISAAETSQLADRDLGHSQPVIRNDAILFSGAEFRKCPRNIFEMACNPPPPPLPPSPPRVRCHKSCVQARCVLD